MRVKRGAGEEGEREMLAKCPIPSDLCNGRVDNTSPLMLEL